MNKNKRKFLIRFWGETEVEAYTENGARTKVEMMKDIKTHERVTTNNIWSVITKGFIMNISAIFQLILLIAMLVIWSNLLKQVTNLADENFRLIGLFVLVIFLLGSLHIPKTITRHMNI